MADDKRGRDKQARDAERRQREREITTELARGDEPPPAVDEAELDELEADLASVSFPATGRTVHEQVGDRKVRSALGVETVGDLLPDATAETFASAAAVSVRVRRPTVATAMKRVVEATESLRNEALTDSQRDAYEKTFHELRAIGDDGDEGIRAVADWIVAQIREGGVIPDSRAVRREAADFCRANGYEVRNDEWLGI